jgi:predicted transcriptional regulator
LIATIQQSTFFLAPACWLAVLGAWIWRGRIRARWSQLGFDSDVFELFVKMKGGATRIRLLTALEVPKDRLQVAQQLGLDWSVVDRHVQLLNKYGFVCEKGTYGTTKVYEATNLGKTLLKLYDELDAADKARIADQKL